jgi:CheY-like chemotaxis protein
MSGFDLFKRLLGSGGERRQHMPRVQAARGLRMLVVDDSPTIRAVLGKMLTQDGYEVSKAGDGESALALARSEKPDLIFLDIVMPGMNGFAVLRALRKDPPTHGIPIVMISGNLQATEQFYVQRFGADDFMKKPFGRAEVFSRIQQLVEAGRLAARDPVLDPPQDLPAETSEAHDAIPDVALPDVDDPHMVALPIHGALVDAVDIEAGASHIPSRPGDERKH